MMETEDHRPPTSTTPRQPPWTRRRPLKAIPSSTSRWMSAAVDVGRRPESDLFNSELHRNPAVLTRSGGRWKGLDDPEISTCSWVSWFNDERLHDDLGHR